MDIGRGRNGFITVMPSERLNQCIFEQPACVVKKLFENNKYSRAVEVVARTPMARLHDYFEHVLESLPKRP